MAGVRLKWNEAELKRLLDDDLVPAAVERAAGKVRDRAKVHITRARRVDTGALRNSITSRRIRTRPGGVWYEVGSDLPYAIYQHEGVTGPIYPRRAKVLRFKPKGSGAYVYARSVSGFSGVPYLTDAMKSLTRADFTP